MYEAPVLVSERVGIKIGRLAKFLKSNWRSGGNQVHKSMNLENNTYSMDKELYFMC